MTITSYIPEQSELGKKSAYNANYSPDTLFPIPRQPKRDEIGVSQELPFHGYDLWNHYEVSWLNEKGKPIVALAEIIYSCKSPYIIESKSMKLYFNSLNNTRFQDATTLEQIIQNDIAEKIKNPVVVKLFPVNYHDTDKLTDLEGICLDELDVECTTYTPDSNYLALENNIVNETVYSNLLKSNCLVTHQPDWGSVQIIYSGRQINHVGLLKYIISFRNHNEFHEQCVERIFMDILRQCKPEKLTVYARYTRRGGLDINPFRSTEPSTQINNFRLIRQ